MNNLERLIDYVMMSEVDDFENYVKEEHNNRDGRLILEWLNDDVEPSEEVKEAFKKLNALNGCHVYSVAFCLRYEIEVCL